MADNRLKSLADRIERLMDERDGIQSDIRDIYVEAKSAGYVPKVLRKAITRKRMDPDKRDEEDTILDLYEGALTPSMRRAVQMAKSGATSREIETETGIDHVTVTRSVSLNKKSETEKEHERSDQVSVATGHHQGGGEGSRGGLAGGAVAEAEQRGSDDFGEGGRVRGVPAPGEGAEGALRLNESPAPRSVGAVAAEPRVAPPFLGDDPGQIPDYLRGHSPANRSLRP